MKVVVISMMNRLLSGAIMKYLTDWGELMPIRVVNGFDKGEPYTTCLSHNANIILMEAMRVPPYTLDKRLETAKKIRKDSPDCKIVILCDENADPEIAEQVKEAKKMRLIDSFFYSSVSGEYLAAMLDAL